MREIREIKANVKFFKFTGLLTDIPDWFWELGFSVSKYRTQWRIYKSDEVVDDVKFGDYILYNRYWNYVDVFTESKLREEFEIIE